MHDGHERDEWSRWSALMALTANCHRDPKKGRAARPSDFMSFGDKEPITDAIQVDAENIGIMRKAFAGRKGLK